MNDQAVHIVYLASSICFILSLRWLNTVPTARRGRWTPTSVKRVLDRVG